MKTLGLLLLLASIPALPQAALAPVGVQQFFDNTGVPLSGGTVTTYIAGTTTKLATYTDATGTIPASNPIVLDAGGFASIWLGSGSYKFVVKRADGVVVSTTDNISTVNAGLIGSANIWTQPQTVGVITAYTSTGTVLGAYSTIQAGITALHSIGGTLVVGPGTWSLGSGLSAASASNLTLRFDRNAIITAAAGVGASPMISVAGLSTNVRVIGGTWNAASIATSCFYATDANTGAQSSSISFEDAVCYNTTGNGAKVISSSIPFNYDYPLKDVRFEHNYFHDVGDYCIRVQSTTGVVVNENRCENWGSNHNTGGPSERGIDVEGAFDVSVTNNSVIGGPSYAGATNPPAAIYLFAVQKCSVSGNRTLSLPLSTLVSGGTAVPSGIHVDTVDGCSVSGANTTQGGNNGIKVEASYNVSTTGNSVSDPGANGVQLINTTAAPTVNALTDATGLIAGSNVALSVDAVIFKSGGASVQADMSSSFTAGTVLYQNLGSTQDWLVKQAVSFYIYSSSELTAGSVSFVASSTNDLANVHTTIPLPHIPATTWALVTLHNNGAAYHWSQNIASWGIIANTNMASKTLHLNALVNLADTRSNAVTGNVISRPGLWGVMVQGNQSIASVHDNTVTDPGYQWNYSCANPGGGITVEENDSAANTLSNVYIGGNHLFFTSTLAASCATGIRLLTNGSGKIDAVTFDPNEATGFPTRFLKTANGGTITNVKSRGDSLAASSTPTFENTADSSFNIVVDAGNSATQQKCFQFFDVGTVKNQLCSDSSNEFVFLLNDFLKFKNASGGFLAQLGPDGAFYFGQNGNSSVFGKLAGTFTGFRTFTFPDTSGAVLTMGNGNSPAQSGSCTMAAGTCSAQSLGHTYAAAPVCFANWTGTGTLTGLIKVPSTTTTVTPASSVGTDTAVTNWFCLGS